mgnify:CR=1 FL=1
MKAREVRKDLAFGWQVFIRPALINLFDIGAGVDFGFKASANPVDEKVPLVFINGLPKQQLPEPGFGLESCRGMPSFLSGFKTNRLCPLPLSLANGQVRKYPKQSDLWPNSGLFGAG